MRVNGNKAPDELPDIRTATTGDYIVTSPAHMSLAEGRGRLWRSLKYEEVYLKAYATVAQARAEIGNWFAYYNGKRLTRRWIICFRSNFFSESRLST